MDGEIQSRHRQDFAKLKGFRKLSLPQKPQTLQRNHYFMLETVTDIYT